MPRSIRRSLLATATAGLAALAIAAPAISAPGDLDLVNITAAGVPGDGDAYDVDVSADGRFVVFASHATNLGPDANTEEDVFVKDMVSGDVTLVSRASDASGGAPGDLDSDTPSISDDGRYVAFESHATNLVAGVTDGLNHIYVRDLLLGTTIVVDRQSAGAGGAVGDDHADEPVISGDGTRVAFESDADDLATADDDSVQNVYVRDLAANTTTLVSRQSQADGGAGADGTSDDPSISHDGSVVSFTSAGDNLSAEDGPDDDIYVRDLSARTTTLVSRASAAAGGAGGDDDSDDSSISADGSHVAFESQATNLGVANPTGRTLIHRRDLQTNTTELVSRRSASDGGTPAGESSYEPEISADGRYVAFESDADNLSADDDDLFSNVFVRDVQDATTTLLSRRSPAEGGTGANDESWGAAISADGRYVAFDSDADNLSGQDRNAYENIFRADVLGDPAPPAGGGTTATTTTEGTSTSGGTTTSTGTTASDLCAPAPPAATPSTDKGEVALTTTQLRINQRISQAAIRRLNAVQAWLDAGVEARDICGGALGAPELLPGSGYETAASPLASLPVADPRPITPEPATQKAGVEFTLTAAQFLINQRIDQAAVRRANALEERLRSGLTGGDVEDGTLTQGQLHDRLHVLAVPAGQVPASETVIAPRATPADPDSVEVSAGQLLINQRIAQAGVKRSNALIAELETGLTGEDLRDGTIGTADWAPGVVG